jgi:nitrite reductase/ring-hydroxylating ferredoxin subunit
MVVDNERWWPLCLSEQVLASKPAALQCGRLQLALYRDGEGLVRAVEDRCPHRRAPLSLGRITADGDIQCGYHGWIFNGANGEVTGFPNLDPGERLPRCSIKTYPVNENAGWVYVWTSEHEPAGAVHSNQPAALAGGHEFHGRTLQALTHGECVAALLDSPGQLLRYLGVEFLDKVLGDPKIEDGLLVADRAARWNLLGESALYVGPLRHRADFPLRLRTYTAPVTGQTSASLYAGEDTELARLQVALVPTTRSMTALCWRATLYPVAHGKLAPLFGFLCKLGRSPVRMTSTVDCAALAGVVPGPGHAWQSMQDVAATTATIVASCKGDTAA